MSSCYINCYVDTRLHPNEKRAFKTYNLKGDIIYNNLNNNDFVAKKAGGTLVSVSPYIKNNYIRVDLSDKLPVYCHGYVQILEFSHKRGARLPFRVIVLYLPTGASYNARRSRLLNAIIDLMRDSTPMHNYCSGDMNFVEYDIDTSSRQGKHKVSKPDYNVWLAFLKLFNLVERHQSGHTYYSIPEKDVTLTRSSRTDRIYTSHSELECAPFAPKAFIPSLPYNILNVYRDSLRRKQEGRPARKVGGKDVPDHLPVGLIFISTAKSKKRSFNLPKWLASNPAYLKEVHRQWVRRSKRPKMRNANGFTKMALFKKTITHTATNFLSKNSIKNSNDKISLLSLCISLIRSCTATTPNIPKIKLFIEDHDYLSDFVKINNDIIDHSKLTNKLNSLLKNALPFNLHDFDKDVRDLSGYSSPASSAEDAPNHRGRSKESGPPPPPDHSEEFVDNNRGLSFELNPPLSPDHSAEFVAPNRGHSKESNPPPSPDNSAEYVPPSAHRDSGDNHRGPSSEQDPKDGHPADPNPPIGVGPAAWGGAR